MTPNPYQQTIHRYYSMAVICIGFLLTFCSDPVLRQRLLDARKVVRNIGQCLFDKFSD